MAVRGGKWTPAEPEAPDDGDRPPIDAIVEADGLSDAHVGRMVPRPLPDLEIVRVRVQRLDAAGAALPGASVRDAKIAAGDLSNAVLADGSLRRIRGRGLGAVGLDVSGSRLEDVRLVGCKLRLARGFGAALTRCVFEDCDLREAEFEGAILDRVVFRGCDLSAARLAGVDLGRCDLRGSVVAGLVVSPDRLRGAMVDPAQLPTFATALGLRVEEAPTP
ncbi:MAG: pentapeptide repeat-containing protein [Phycisphaera sp.]|nr:MAG: pentapeptide repeat-containing protein [Phycisphaera sp.]